MKVGQGK